ncbi:hypothetical protein MTO96_002269 [Rhipicephalus appendiculatus]
MGQVGSQVGTPEELQNLSESDKGAIREAWRSFCNSHPDPGAFLFSALLERHPEYQALFKEFRDVPRSGLVNVPFFKTHCTAMAKLLSDVVGTLDKPALLADMVRTNALAHATRDVLPLHFESLWQLVETRVGLGAPGYARSRRVVGETARSNARDHSERLREPRHRRQRAYHIIAKQRRRKPEPKPASRITPAGGQRQHQKPVVPKRVPEKPLARN